VKLRYRFKRAETESEFEQIFRLNHATFASELEQYPELASGQLVDKFHDKNLYIIALAGDQVVGMISLHAEPPFSVAGKLADASVLEELGRVIEVRLLAVQPEHRNGAVMAGLMLGVYEHATGYDTIVISGHIDQCGLYRELGFTDLGPHVVSGQATYVPMAIRVTDLAQRQARWKRRIGYSAS
jgi:predicted N-acetyltransferase YhbS